MAKITLNDLANITGNETAAIAALNENNDLIEAAIENTLSRDGTSPNAMNADFDMNGYDLINVSMINGQDANNLVGPQGPQGPAGTNGTNGTNGADGAAATVTIGTTSTLTAGSSATVTNVGTTSAAVLNFGIPKGADGVGAGDMTKATYDPANVSEQLVGLTATQTLTNKTLTNPTLTTPTIAKLANLTSNGLVKTSGGDGTLSVDTTAYAPLASPALTGTPTAPTATSGTNTTQIATTAYTDGAVATEAALRVAKAGDTMTGVLVANVGVSLATGATTPAQGQLAFPATQNPSSDANTLDDYEEGTWTPVLNFGGAATGITYGTPTTGRYTKIGRHVIVSAAITLTSKGTATGNAQIINLPFTAVNDQVFACGSVGWAINLASVTGALQTMVQPNSSKFNFYQSVNGTSTLLTNANFSNTTSLYVTYSYDAA